MLVAAGLVLVGQGRTHELVAGVSAFRPGLVLGVLGLVLWFLSHQGPRSPARLFKVPAFKAALFVAAWAVVGVPFSISLGGSATFLLESFSRTLMVFLILAAAVRHLQDVRRLVGAVAVGAAIWAVGAPVSRYTGGGVGGYDPNDSAMFLVSGIPLLVYFALHGRSPWIRACSVLGGLGAIVAILDTQSRAGFLGLVSVLVFMLLMLKAIKPAVRVAVVALIIIAAIPMASSEYWERMQTITELDDGYGGGGGGRLETWKRGLGYTWENPITGIGLNQFGRREGLERGLLGMRAAWRVSHSSWIQVLSELGVPGFLGFFGMFLMAFKSLWQIQRSRGHPFLSTQPEEFQALAGLLMASLLGTLVAGSFLTHGYTGLMWGPAAIVIGLGKVSPWDQVTHRTLALKGKG